MVTAVKQLMNKRQAQGTQFAYGSHRPQFGAKVAAADVPHAKRGEALETAARNGGNHPETHSHDVAVRDMVAIYNRYVAVYDKVSTTRKRKSYHRRPATVMQSLNGALKGRPRGGSLVEHILRGQE